jgi:allantoinase
MSPVQNHLKPLLDAGIKGFKCFLIESGVDVRPLASLVRPTFAPNEIIIKQEFPCVSKEDLEIAMHVLQVSTFT